MSGGYALLLLVQLSGKERCVFFQFWQQICVCVCVWVRAILGIVHSMIAQYGGGGGRWSPLLFRGARVRTAAGFSVKVMRFACKIATASRRATVSVSRKEKRSWPRKQKSSRIARSGGGGGGGQLSPDFVSRANEYALKCEKRCVEDPRARRAHSGRASVILRAFRSAGFDNRWKTHIRRTRARFSPTGSTRK